MSEQRAPRRLRLRRVSGRAAMSSALELLGIVLLVAGVALLSVPVALMVAGIGCVIVAQGVGQ